MYRVDIRRGGRSLSSKRAGLAALIFAASTLGGCAMTPPIFGARSSPPATASLAPRPSRNYALGAPPAAYPKPSTQPVPRRNTRWDWSGPRRGSTFITVRPGQSLYRIATYRRVAISELMAANRLSGPNIRPGQQLLVPLLRGERQADRRAQSFNAPARGFAPQQSGRYRDTAPPRVVTRYDDRAYQKRPRLFERSRQPLSGRRQQDYRRAATTQRGYDPAMADYGSRPPAGRGYTRSYVVRPGDTLYSIARRTGVSARQLSAHNALVNPSNLQAGTMLTIPR